MLRVAVNANVTCPSAALAGDLARASGPLIVHHDRDHGRAVLTYVGTPGTVLDRLRGLCLAALDRAPPTGLDEGFRAGVHPATGIVDVVPWVPLEGIGLRGAARLARSFATWWGAQGVPVHPMGWPDHPHRRAYRALPVPAAWRTLPGRLAGPDAPHPSMGVTLTGARPWLVPFNLWLGTDDLDHARTLAPLARALPGVEALALPMHQRGQVMLSMNLTRPTISPPDRVVQALGPALAELGVDIERGEVVGVVPRWLDEATDWSQARTPRPPRIPPL